MGKNNKMAVASSNSAPHHSIRYGITKKGIEENHKERNHEKNIVVKFFGVAMYGLLCAIG